MRSFSSRQACIDYYEQQFPTLPISMIELALDYDIEHPLGPNDDPAKHLENLLSPEAKNLATQLEAEHVKYEKGEVLHQGTVYDSPDDVPILPLAPGLEPGEALDSESDSDSDAEENCPRMKKSIWTSNSDTDTETSLSLDEADSEEEPTCVTIDLQSSID